MDFNVTKRTKIRKVVKYFRQKDEKYFRNREFKFGTLVEYRSYEGESQRLSDGEEGLFLRVVEALPTLGLHVPTRIPDISYNGHTLSGNTVAGYIGDDPHRPRGVVFERKHNAHVMCFSIGPYSKLHHKKMMNGGVSVDGSDYIGDHSLNMAAEIDLDKFIALLGNSFGRDKRVLGSPVEYGERRVKVQASELQLETSPKGKDDELKKAVFTKHPRFSVEEEYRLLLYNSDGTLICNDQQPYCFKSRRLYKSILRIMKARPSDND